MPILVIRRQKYNLPSVDLSAREKKRKRRKRRRRRRMRLQKEGRKEGRKDGWCKKRNILTNDSEDVSAKKIKIKCKGKLLANDGKGNYYCVKNAR